MYDVVNAILSAQMQQNRCQIIDTIFVLVELKIVPYLDISQSMSSSFATIAEVFIARKQTMKYYLLPLNFLISVQYHH